MFNSIALDNKLIKFFNYGLRESREHDTQKDDQLKSGDLFEKYLFEFSEFSDLFIHTFKCTPQELVELFDFLISLVGHNILKNLTEIYNIGDNINPQEYAVYFAFTESIHIHESQIEIKFQEKFNYILSEFSLSPFDLDEDQRLFDQVARKPFLKVDDYFILSPEIILDSLFVNTHYKLLECSQNADEYKSRSSTRFIDNICLTASKAGFIEVGREKDVFNGRHNLGDIDLILKNDEGDFLLIEAKNHTLPLSVYWHQFEAESKRLEYQQNDWERKVLQRISYLKGHYNDYGISASFKYIIVTKRPEILSHFSEILVLSLFEFENWICSPPLKFNFHDVYANMESHYSINEEDSLEEVVNKANSLGLDWLME